MLIFNYDNRAKTMHFAFNAPIFVRRNCMKRLVKTILCFALAVSLCLGIGAVSFAGETGSDASLSDLLALLAALNGGEEGGEEVPEEAPAGAYSVGPVSFSVPDTMNPMQEETAGDELMFMSEDFTTILSASYFEAPEGENIDLTDTTNQEMLLSSFGGDGEVTAYDLIEVDGHNAMWMEVVASGGYTTYNLVLQLESGIAPFSFASMGEDDGYEVFDSIIDSIKCGAAAPAPAPAPAPAGGEPAAVSADAIDATLVDEVVLFDDDVCKVTMKKFSTEDDYYAFTCKVYLENKTDLNLYFSTDYTAVNDYMVNAYFGETVAAHHKTNAEMHFYKDDLAENNITDIGTIAFRMIVRDDDDWSADYLEDQKFVVLPFGPDVPAQPEQVFDDDDIVLADENGIKMILTGFDTEDDYYFRAFVYCENNTDQDVRFSLDSSSAINGYEIYPYLFEYVPAGMKSNTDIHWYWEDLEDNDIEVIEDLELAIEVEDYNDYWADPVFKDTVFIELQ